MPRAPAAPPARAPAPAPPAPPARVPGLNLPCHYESPLLLLAEEEEEEEVQRGVLLLTEEEEEEEEQEEQPGVDYRVSSLTLKPETISTNHSLLKGRGWFSSTALAVH